MLISLNQPWPGNPQPLGIRFEFLDDTGPRLHLGLVNPTPREVRGAARGRLRLALVPAGKHTLFLLVQQPELFAGWADAPFAWGKVPSARRCLDDKSPSSNGYLFGVYLTDQHSVVRALRVATVTPTFTTVLDEAIREQARHLGEFSVAAYDAEVAAAYRRWPRSDDMVRAACVVEALGIPFGSGGEG
ncbi:hypothetical protein [Azospirillum endophyticum]